MSDAVFTIRAHLHPGRRPEVNEVDRIITDHELMMQDIREGIQEGLFIISTIALFVWGCWVFV